MAEPIGFGERTGDIDLIDWDKAVAIHLGGVLHPKGLWVLPVRDVIPARRQGEFKRKRVRAVPIFYQDPEPHVIKATLPQIKILNDSADPDETRRFTGTVAYRCPAPGSPIVSAGGVLGAQQWEQKDQEPPFNLTYTIEVRARTRTMARVLSAVVLKRFPLRGGISVTDSLDVERRYTTYLESGPTDLGELNSVVERIMGYSITFRIEGALTNEAEKIISQGYTGIIRPRDEGPFNPGDPNDPNSGDPDPGDFGYYGEGPGGVDEDGNPTLTVEPIYPPPEIVDC